MTDDLKMPEGKEGMEEELRMVVMNLTLPKAVWWALDNAQNQTGLSTSDELANLLKRDLLLMFAQVLIEGL